MSNWIRKGAGLLAGLLLLGGGAASAEERRLGDYIYVPAITAPGNMGTQSLRVEGMALGAKSDEAQRVESLAGAEFGVYVFSADGELVPWANPLYPSEQMRIRSGESVTRFSLPQGTEFYLRQESAPAGYLCDESALYRVEGDEIVITNHMPGELMITVCDTLGKPLPAAELTVTFEDGTKASLVTDENGEAVLACTQAGVCEIEQTVLPEDAFDPLRVTVDGAAVESAIAQVQPAQRTRVVFEHPAAGSVKLMMTLTDIDANAQTTSEPLENVRMEISGTDIRTIVTDEAGEAGVSLLEGTYQVAFFYDGNRDIVLPVEQGQMVITSGADTVIELAAKMNSGRVAVQCVSDRALSGGSFTLEHALTGGVCGPYPFDAEGLAVSDALPAGEYLLSDLTLPDDALMGGVTVGGQECLTDSFNVTVAPGEVCDVAVSLLMREKQSFSLFAQSIDDDGEVVDSPIGGLLDLTLVDADGVKAAELQAQDGYVRVEALTGDYRFVMSAKDAGALGVSAQSELFHLPGDEVSVAFPASGARLIIESVDENGQSISGAVYSVQDAEAAVVSADAGSETYVVTPVIAPGEAVISTVTPPAGYDAAADCVVTAQEGEAARVQIVHESYGTAALSVCVQSLDERGNPVYRPLAGTGVSLMRVERDGTTLIDLEMTLLSGEDGLVEVRLEPGHYAAVISDDDLPAGCIEGGVVDFVIANTQQTQARVLCYDAMGGVRVEIVGGELTDEELAQMRFELRGDNGGRYDMAPENGSFYVGGLPAGGYTLRQTQIPVGYTLCDSMAVAVEGGMVTDVSVPLEEYAMLSVSKTGITFNDTMQMYVVPLTGEYGVYTMQDGEMVPYPQEGKQMTVWANVTPEQIVSGRVSQLRLPAGVEGTTYYLREIGGAAGFAQDEEFHEVSLIAGQTQVVSCTVSSDRGFFALDSVDAATGGHVAGGVFELIDSVSGESVLTFTPQEETYRNAMALPVGEYILRQTSAPQGYALSEPAEQTVIIEPYLEQGGAITAVRMAGAKIPAQAGLDAIRDMYAAQQEGLTLVCIDGGSLVAGETLRLPQMTFSVRAQDGTRTDIASIVLGGVSDLDGAQYVARVEYCLFGGGWQPSDARMTGLLSAPTSVSLADVKDDISAIRVTYINADTGEEKAGSGFTLGQMAVSVEAEAGNAAALTAEAVFGGEYAYTTTYDGAVIAFTRTASAALDFACACTGSFDTAIAGRDGRITGVVFFDTDSDGVLSAGETGRYAGMTVSLSDAMGEITATTRTDGTGRYEFTQIPAGEYSLHFDGGDRLVFSSGAGYSDHVISGVQDARYGMSGTLSFDGDHSDYVVNAGCIYAAQISGRVTELLEDGTSAGYDGLMIDLITAGQTDEEPTVVMTDSTGAFRMAGLLPGEYELIINLPQGYLCRDAQNGVIRRSITLSQSEELDLGEHVIGVSAGISGRVFVDEDGEGVLSEGAKAMAGVSVSLLEHQDGHTQTLMTTTTDENGGYAFGGLFSGEYSVLFELGENWTFTRYGEDSHVYGAMSSSGSTQSFMLYPGNLRSGVNAGATMPASLSVFVFEDEHGDGNRGVYDVGLEGVTVSLIRQEDGEDAQEITRTTGKDGMITFEGVSPGEYVLSYQMPGSYRATKQVQSDTYPTSCVPQTTLSTGRSDVFTLRMGESGTRKYIGAMRSGSIAGVVYYDNDADARAGENEEACAGTLVELLNASGEAVDTRMTDENGAYLFDGLAPGRYSVRFHAQEGCGFSGTERSMSRSGVQKSDENISSTRSISVSTGSKITTADAGVVRLGSVRGRIWEDSSADCVADETERGLAGVQVHLMSGNGRSILASAATDADGSYAFERVTPGTYLLRVDLPDNYVFSGVTADNPLPVDDVRDGRGYTQAFELLGGAHAQGIDYGMLTQGSVSGRVWIDENYDGRIGEEEEGLRGATITLTTTDGAVVDSMSTIRSGEFSFDGLMPGDYMLSVSLGEEYVFTAAGGQSLMDRIDQSSASLYVGELTMGGTIANLTIGAIRPAGVSGLVFVDENNDGRRADNEAKAAGVLVTLTMLSGSDAGLQRFATTDETGSYAFENVMPGEAELTFGIGEGYAFAKQSARGDSIVAMSDALSATSEPFTVRSGAKYTGRNAGIVPVGTISGSVWEDSRYDGVRNNGETGIAGARIALLSTEGDELSSAVTDETGAYTIGFVRPGSYVLSCTLPDGRIFTCEGESRIALADASAAQTERFAVKMGESLSGVDFGAIVPSMLEGSVLVDWNENGVCEEDEPGLEGAVVTVMQGGTVVANASTDEFGVYRVNSLRPGVYRVRVALPQDALFTRGVSLSLASADAQEGETGEYTLAMGQQETIPAIPAVKTTTVTGQAWMDMNTDGCMSEGEAPLSGVMAELLGEDGSVLRQTTTGEDGGYEFDLIRSGSYAVRFTLGDGALFADQTGEPGGSCVPAAAGSMSKTALFTVGQDEVIDAMNVGAILPGRIGDSVFLDSNANGMMDYREPLIAGVALELLRVNSDGSRELAAQTVSDEYGYYFFDDLRPGSYVLRVTLQDDDLLTQHLGMPLHEIDSDVNPDTGETATISLVSGQTLRNVDIGFIRCVR